MQLRLWPLDSLLCRAGTTHGIRTWMAIYRNTRKPNLSKLSPSLLAIGHRCADRHVSPVSMAAVGCFRYIWTSTEMEGKTKINFINKNSERFEGNYWFCCQLQSSLYRRKAIIDNNSILRKCTVHSAHCTLHKGRTPSILLNSQKVEMRTLERNRSHRPFTRN